MGRDLLEDFVRQCVLFSLHQTSSYSYTETLTMLTISLTDSYPQNSSMSSETHTVWEDTKEVRGSDLGSGWCMKVGITNGCKWSPPTTHELPADILHPLATIQWETCWELEGIFCDYISTSTVVLDDKLYFGVTFGGKDGEIVLEFSADLAAWKVPPASDFGLSTYHSQLVLVGGELNGTTSNKLWVYDNDTWHCSLPPMPTGSCSCEHWHTRVPRGGWRLPIY